MKVVLFPHLWPVSLSTQLILNLLSIAKHVDFVQMSSASGLSQVSVISIRSNLCSKISSNKSRSLPLIQLAFTIPVLTHPFVLFLNALIPSWNTIVATVMLLVMFGLLLGNCILPTPPQHPFLVLCIFRVCSLNTMLNFKANCPGLLFISNCIFVNSFLSYTCTWYLSKCCCVFVGNIMSSHQDIIIFSSINKNMNKYSIRCTPCLFTLSCILAFVSISNEKLF